MAKTSKELVDAANAEIETISVKNAKLLLDDPKVTFVDLRDVRELKAEGTIPGAYHMPRGMIEFWADPESSYYKKYSGLIINLSFIVSPAGAARSRPRRRKTWV